MLHKTIISSLILLMSLSFVQAQNYQNYTTYVIAKSLRLRTAPAPSGKTIKLLAYRQQLEIIPSDSPGKKDTIDNINGHWIHVIAGQDSGYVFSGYVFGYPPELPKSDVIMLDPDALNYSNYTFSPHYHWYRLGEIQGERWEQGLTPVHVEFFVGNGLELDARVHDSLPGYIIGFKEKQQAGPIKTNRELDDIIKRLDYYPGLKLLPGQHFFLWTTMHIPGEEQPLQRNSFHLLVTGNVKKTPYLVAEDYQIVINHSTESMYDATQESYTVTTNLFGFGENESPTMSLVSSCEQYLEFSTPCLRFAGDINHDGMPDLITYSTDDKTSYEVLILSEITPKGVRYKIAAMIEYGPGC
ncbi:MAG: SH3 domain-containing protein [Bacteroidia bacterium]